MPLDAGVKLGPYEIVAPIGAGGMGEVYKARDTKLDRNVAIKVLPEAFAEDEERLARFEREAKLLASLNHPNIAGIYGFESGALVLELVEGPTLAEKIQQGTIPVDEAIAIAKQIAEALAAGHEAGVIHRDLKPANVKLKEDGTVKVLDYGLAKAFEDPAVGGVDSELSQSPTLTRGTQVGVILGTAAYMSPEQAKGKRVDKRTDVWAFGAVVYEMVTGKRAFEGDDVSDTLAAVLRAEPDLNRLPRDASAALRRTLELCLTKDANARVHDIADVRLAMEGAFETAPTSSETTASRHRALPWAVAASVLTALVVWSLTRPGPPEVNRFAYDFPADHVFRITSRSILAVSPDGRRFTYNTTDGLYLRSMDQLDARVLPGTEARTGLSFFSPDGQWVAFSQGGSLKRLALSGGAPIVICPVFQPYGAHWASDDTIFFSQSEGIFRVSATGGTPELVVAPEDGERVDAPQLLPDGDSLLLSVSAGRTTQNPWNDARIDVVSLASGERTVLVEGGSDARYIASGHLVYALEDGLVAVAFDAASLRVSGGAVSLVQGLFRAGSTASANYAVSRDGTLFLLAGANADDESLAWVDRTGRVDVIDTIPPNHYEWPSLSADGERLLVVGGGDARIYDLASGRESRMTTDGATDYLRWTPSGTEVTYSSTRGSNGDDIWIQPADGSGEARQLTSLDGGIHFDGWAPDGRTFLAHQHFPETVNQLVVAYDGEKAEPRPWLDNEHNDRTGVFSPDGNYVAYVSNQTGQREIYIRPFPGPGGQTTVSVGGGSEPTWSPNGELFYRRPGDYTMMAVEVSTDPVLDVGQPVELFAGNGQAGSSGMSANARYTVTPDGQRFIMSTALLASDATGSRSSGRVVIVQNWVEELKERVPN